MRCESENASGLPTDTIGHEHSRTRETQQRASQDAPEIRCRRPRDAMDALRTPAAGTVAPSQPQDAQYAGQHGQGELAARCLRSAR
jgi:hypothetical protein